MEASEASGSKFHGRDAHDPESQSCTHEPRRHRPCHFCLDESGIALPVALGVLFVIAGLATVTARASIIANHQTFRDISVKRATQAAFAGVQTLRYQTNLLQPDAAQCVAKSALDGTLSLVPVQADAWCDPQTRGPRRWSLLHGADLFLDQHHRERTAAGAAQDRLDRDGRGSKRRIALTIYAATGAPLFP